MRRQLTMSKMLRLFSFLALMYMSCGALAGAPPIPPPAPYNPYPTYLGQVATRTFLSNTLNSAGPQQTMSRTIHYARDNITSLAVIFSNWYVPSNSAELGTGASTTVTASIEYPVGTFTQVKFSGATSGTIPNLSNLQSDFATVTIPRGAAFYVRMWTSNSVGIIFNASVQELDISNGEGFTFGVTTPDLTLGGALPGTSTANTVGPTAIIAYTNRPSVFLAGDSRVACTADAFSDTSDDCGSFGRGVGPFYAYINGGVSGARVATDITGSNYANRLALSKFSSTIICDLGVNDLSASASAATIWANLQTFYGFFSGKPIIQSTIWPEVTSTDNFTSVANQTTTSTSVNTQRIALNGIIRASPSPLVGFIDDTTAIETGLNSGLWNVTGSTQITAGTYTSGSGAFTLTTASNHGIQVGESFYVSIVSTGSLTAYFGFFTATAGTTGTTLNFTGATGLGISAISNGAVNPWTKDGIHPTPIGYLMIKNYNQPLLRAIIAGKQ